MTNQKSIPPAAEYMMNNPDYIISEVCDKFGVSKGTVSAYKAHITMGNYNNTPVPKSKPKRQTTSKGDVLLDFNGQQLSAVDFGLGVAKAIGQLDIDKKQLKKQLKDADLKYKALRRKESDQAHRILNIMKTLETYFTCDVHEYGAVALIKILIKKIQEAKKRDVVDVTPFQKEINQLRGDVTVVTKKLEKAVAENDNLQKNFLNRVNEEKKKLEADILEEWTTLAEEKKKLQQQLDQEKEKNVRLRQKVDRLDVEIIELHQHAPSTRVVRLGGKGVLNQITKSM